MTPASKNAEARAVKVAAREKRAYDAALAMHRSEADRLAILDKTARVRALRLAKAAANALQPKSKPPINKAG